MPLQVCFAVFLFFSLSVTVFGQELSENFDATQIRQATKIDEFGDIPAEEFVPKLQSFAELLDKNKTLEGYIVFYSGFNDVLFRQTTYFAERKTQFYYSYLTRHLPGCNVGTMLGGLSEKMNTELWIVPAGGALPSSVYKLEHPRQLLYTFDLLETQSLNFKPDGASDSDESNESLEILDKIDTEDLLMVLGKVLKKYKSLRGVLIYYLNDAKTDVQESRQAVERFFQENAKNKLDPRRVKLLYGGYRKESVIESWAIPNNENDPETMPDAKF